MNPRLVAGLLRAFNQASLSDKVIIAGALHYAKYHNRDIIDAMKKAWSDALKIEIELQHVVELYTKGLADYTSILKKYEDVVEFIALALGEALS